jgi:hypothetical protein
MKRFVLIDHSMSDLAGHHYEYAMHVLRAAEAAGYQPVLATNRKFRERDAAPWDILPLYEFGFWPEPSRAWHSSLAAKLGPVLRKSWCALRCRMLYSKMGLAWSCRFEWKRYLQLRPAAWPAMPHWILGITVIFAVKVLRMLSLVLMLPLVAVSAGLWLLLRLLRGGASLGGRVALQTAGKAALPRPFTRYFRLLGEEIAASTRFVVSFLQTFVATAKKEKGPSKQQARQSSAFARDTARLLSHIRPQPDDVFFFPTISPQDLVALSKPLTSNPEARHASWHFLFRRNLYVGREGDYARQDVSLNPMRDLFHRFLRNSGGVRAHFYTDTEELTDQHNRLGVFPFHTLPIPHTHSLEDRTPHAGPLRFTYLGDARAEKGFHLLPRLAADIRPDCLRPGKARFVVQCNFNIPNGEPRAAVARAKLEGLPQEYVELYKRPLSSDQYRCLLLSADVSLLFYDPLNYHARSSGILVESLAAGIPVIVPAGSWLARQFLERHRAHLASLPDRMRTLAAHVQQAIPWQRHGDDFRPDCSLRLQASSDRKIYSWFFVPPGSTHLLIRADFDGGARHAQVVVSELDWHEQPVGDSRTFLLEPSGEHDGAAVLVPLQPELFRIWCAFGGLGEAGDVSLRNIQVDFLRPLQGEAAPPRGAVGAIYQNESDISELARDLVRHYPHYQRTAAEFAAGWRDYHNAGRLVSEMVGLAGRPASLEPATALSGSGAR